jgi:hypothetical protein
VTARAARRRSTAPRIEVDPAQHACFRDPRRDANCCRDGPSERGCRPKADPPSATLEFADAASGETLELRDPLA